MDFDSPDVMKEFPGLYSTDMKKKANDSDYNDENDKSTKKDMLKGKRKDKKDKDKGYAALEGESSDEESQQKSRKSKAFKFTKSKDKEKEKTKERDKHESRKKDRPRKGEKSSEKSKIKKSQKLKHSLTETIDIADAMPIFGVTLDLAVQRGKCHDGIAIPLPIRECIDYVEAVGLTFEGVYKVSGAKNKVSQIRKMYNHRQRVRLSDYDVPTATSLLKMFLRDLPEPIFTNDLLIRFEEAGAILNLNTREKHLKNLVDSLPPLNRLLLSWLIIHLNNVTLKEHLNKMNKQSLAGALNHTFHISSRLLQALIHHSRALFPNVTITKYIPPLECGTLLPEKPHLIEIELAKLESLLNQIHQEMNIGYFSKTREEHLWEVQRITTELKRKLKKSQKNKETLMNDKGKENEETPQEILNAVKLSENSTENTREKLQIHENNISEETLPVSVMTNILSPDRDTSPSESHNNEHLSAKEVQNQECVIINATNNEVDEDEEDDESYDTSTDSDDFEKYHYYDEKLINLRVKNNLLKELTDQLSEDITTEKSEIEELQEKIDFIMREKAPLKKPKKHPKNPQNFYQVKDLLNKENQMLQIKKMNLVRQIMEERELCAELTAKLKSHEYRII